jgi:polar amino acid transport system substrate-binding protein
VGREVRFEFYPWARSFDLALTGAVQAVSYAYGADSREREFLLSDPITHERLVIFYRKGQRMPVWNSLRDLHGNVIGVTRSFAYTDELWDLARQGVFTLNVANTDQLNFAKLLGGRIDLFIAAERVGYRTLRTRFSPNEAAVLASTAKAVVDHQGYLAFSRAVKDGEKLRQEFNRGLRILKETGAYAAMYQDLLDGRYDEGVTW